MGEKHIFKQINITIQRQMLFCKNKEAFKKTTKKVDHPTANKAILDLIQQKFNAKTNQKSQVQIENSPIDRFEKSQSPKKSSLYSAENVSRNRLDVFHPLDIHIDNRGKFKQTQEQYIQVLEQKLQKAEEQLKKSVYKPNQYELTHLYRAHQQARNLILISSMELVQWQNQIINGKKQTDPQKRIDSIAKVLAKNEAFIQVQGSLIDKKQDVEKLKNMKANEVAELKALCSYQEKIIIHLKDQNKSYTPVNQLKLLRYQIHRLTNQNEKLRQMNCDMNSKIETPSKNRSSRQYSSTYQRKVVINIEPAQKASANTQKQGQLIFKIQELQTQLRRQRENNFKLETEKQYLMDMIEDQKNYKDKINFQSELIADLTRENTTFKAVNKDLQKQIENMQEAKKNQIKRPDKEELISVQEMDEIEIVKRALQQDKQAFNGFLKILRVYDSKLRKVRQSLQQCHDQKDRAVKWTKNAFHILQQIEKSQPNASSQINKHLNHYYEMQRNENKIDKLLKQVKALSVGIGSEDMTNIQQQLDEYIITLRGRVQSIKQVEDEDGSSIGQTDQSIFAESFNEIQGEQ